jgi:hypothetical protein
MVRSRAAGVHYSRGGKMKQAREQLQLNYDRATAENTFLIQYLSDVENGIKPCAIEREGKGEDRIEAKLYRATAGHGGIAVLKYRTDDKWDTHIYSLDEISRKFDQDHSVYSLNVRIVLARLTIARNKQFESQIAA